MKNKIQIFLLSTLLFTASCSFRHTRPKGWHEKGISEYFKTKYTKQYYANYNGKISFTQLADNIYIDYDSIDVHVKINAIETPFNEIFKTNLFSPQMLLARSHDSISICCIHELTYIKTKRTQRRFVYWIFQKNFMNPFEYLLELSNDKANRKTNFNTFLKEAKITFLSDGVLIF